MTRKKLPPYAKRGDVCDDGHTIYVLMGWESWKHASKAVRSRGMIYPADDMPEEYTWPVRGCGAVILDAEWTNTAAHQALIDELIKSGAESAQVLDVRAWKEIDRGWARTQET